MIKTTTPRRHPARGPKIPISQVLAIEPVAAARAAIRSRRQATGSSDVSQGDVDVAAEALVRARLRPYARLITAITGGSLSTVGPLFDDWWDRFASRGVDPNSPALDLPTKVSMHARLLVAQFEAAIREQICDVADPQKALVAAAQLGEHQALRARATALTQERDQLRDRLASLTYKVAELETQLRETATARADDATQLLQATERLERALTTASSVAQKRRSVPLEDLAKQVHRLTAAFTRLASPGRAGPTPVKRSTLPRPTHHQRRPASPTSASRPKRPPNSRKKRRQGVSRKR